MAMIHTIRFGEVEVPDAKVIRMSGGILGFPESERYVMLDHEPGSPFHWLQSAQEPEIAFVVVDPLQFFPEYRIQVKKEELAELGAADPDDLSILVILSLRGEPRDMTANLQGPLIVNTKTMTGRQLVLRDTKYTTKHLLFPEARPGRPAIPHPF
jgi:flagellar assembly factor FliW